MTPAVGEDDKERMPKMKSKIEKTETEHLKKQESERETN